MIEPVLTGHAADRITERLEELADLAAIMREPAKPSARGQAKSDKKGKKGVVLLVGIVPVGAGGFIVSSSTFLMVSGHVHAAASGVALLIALLLLIALFGGKKSGGSSNK